MNKLRKKFRSFEEKCIQIVKTDKIKGGVYLGPLILTENPDYCLVGKEPSQRGDTKEHISKGYKNFLSTKQDYILNYCSFKFLCNGKFSYVITDLSKNAMKVKEARKEPLKRYGNWKNVFEEEIKLYKNPFIILIGTSLINVFTRLNLSYNESVLHYSRNNIKNINKYFELNITVKIEKPKDLKKKLIDFTKLILSQKNVNYSEEMISRILEKNFKKDLSEFDYRLYSYYKNRFKHIKQL